MRTWGAWLAGTVVLLAAPFASADTCPAPDGGNPKLASIDASERIAFLKRTVDDQARYASRWKWAWFGIGWVELGASAGTAAVYAATGDPKTRTANVVDNLIAAGFSLGTPVSAFFFAPRVEGDAPVIDRLVRDTGGGAAGTCLVLARMEELVAKGAKDEAQNAGIVTQVISLLGLGALVGILAIEAAASSDPDVANAHWVNAGINGAAGLVLVEAQILTSPTGEDRAYRAYLKGDLGSKSVGFSVVPLVATPGVALRVTF